MCTLDNITAAKELFIKDKYATKATGIEILEFSDDYAKCSFTVDDRHMNAMNSVMGGALFTLADFTFAIVSNFNKPYSTVTSSTNMTYIKSVSNGTVYSESKLIHNGKTCCTYEISITNSNDDLLAVAIINGIHVYNK